MARIATIIYPYYTADIDHLRRAQVEQGGMVCVFFFSLDVRVY